MLGFVPLPNLQDWRSHFIRIMLGFVPLPNLQAFNSVVRSIYISAITRSSSLIIFLAIFNSQGT